MSDVLGTSLRHNSNDDRDNVLGTLSRQTIVGSGSTGNSHTALDDISVCSGT